MSDAEPAPAIAGRTKPKRVMPHRQSTMRAPWKPGQFTPSNEILPRLIQGDSDCAKDRSFLRENRITHVLTIGAVHPDEEVVQHQDLRVCEIDVDDSPSANLTEHFDEAIRFIHEGRSSGGSVYVHCYSGITTSSAVVAAYLIAWLDIKFNESLRFLRHQRPCVNPSASSKKQLKGFANDTETVEKLHSDLLKVGKPGKCEERLKEEQETFAKIMKICEEEDAII